MGRPQDRSALKLRDRTCGGRYERRARTGAAIAGLASRVLARGRVPVFDLTGFGVEPFETARGADRRDDEPGRACTAGALVKHRPERGHDDRQSDQPGPVFAQLQPISHARILAVQIRQLQLRCARIDSLRATLDII